MIAAQTLLRLAGAWLLSTKAGRVLLAIVAIVLGLMIFGAWRERQGTQHERARMARQDNQAVERADEAERAVRRDPDDLSRSLRQHRF